ncbi:MAG: GNAT family N-acetyltransferase [Phototrophicaceae bacterium]
MSHAHDVVALQRLYTYHERVHAAEIGYRAEITPTVVRYIDPQKQHSFVLHSTLTVENADQAIAEQIAYFDHPFEWKWYDYDQPADLLQRLEQHGFQIGEEEALMVLPIPNPPLAVNLPSEFSMRTITNPDDLGAVLNAVQNPVFESEQDGWMNVALAEELRNYPESLLFWAVYDGDQPISAAWLRVSEDSPFGSLWGGATLPAYRGQGIYTALVAQRMVVAHERGKQYLTVDASPMSRPILQRRGFITLAHTRECVSPHP